jgi:hypothetical protein
VRHPTSHLNTIFNDNGEEKGINTLIPLQKQHPPIHQRINALKQALQPTTSTNKTAKMHLPTLTLLTTSLAALSSATIFHNNFGHDGWLQDDRGTQVFVKNKNTATIGGGWGFFWVAEDVCHQNSVAYGWPADYGGAYCSFFLLSFLVSSTWPGGLGGRIRDGWI